MWKTAIITLLIQLLLYVVGRIVEPEWLSENVHVWLPAAFAVFLIVLCWDLWPRLNAWQHQRRWLSIGSAASLYRDINETSDYIGSAAEMLDKLTVESDGDLAAVFMSWVEFGLSEELLDVWGRPINGNKMVKVVYSKEDPIIEHNFSKHPPGTIATQGGRVYTDIEIKRSSLIAMHRSFTIHD